ncbi:MAG: hypothetical protein ACOCTT_00865, partial [archaeon]
MMFGIMWIYSKINQIDLTQFDFVEIYFSEKTLDKITKIKKPEIPAIVHAPFGKSEISSKNTKRRKKAIENIKKSINIANQLKSNKVIY